MTKIKSPNSFDSANLFSRIFFLWVNKFIKKTEKEPFNQNMHESLTKQLDMFRKETDFCADFSKNISLYKTSLKDFHSKFFVSFSIIILCIIECFQVLVLVLMTKYLNSEEVVGNGPDRLTLGFYFSLIVLTQIFISCFEILSKYSCALQMIKLRNNYIFRLLERSLNVNFTTSSITSKGNVINLVQIDCQNFVDNGENAYNGLYGLINSVFCIILGYILISYFFLIYTASAFFFIVLVVFFFNKKMNVENILLKERDKRINFLTSSISNIRYIKYNVYEIFYSKIAHFFRKIELNHIMWLYIFFGIASFFNWMAPGINVVVTFFAIFKKKFVINVAILMGMQRIVYIIENSFRMVPMMLQAVFKFSLFFKRVEIFKSAGLKNSIHSFKGEENSSVAVKIKGEFFYNENPKNDFSLKIEDLEIRKGELVFVVGQLGSGKSSLIRALFGELKKTEESEVKINGEFCYCCQDGFVLSKSVKDNILFYDDFDEDRLKKAVRMASLEGDIEDFENGLDKMIGDSGTKISKGQKIRINLARCFYKDYDIYFFDDPFSALDMNVAKSILENSILGELKKKTRIIVTHSLHYLQYADRIIFIGNNEILFNGTYMEYENQNQNKILIHKKEHKNSLSSEDLDSLDEENEYDQKKEDIKSEEKNYFKDDQKKGRKIKYSFFLLRKYFGGIFFLFITVLSSFLQTYSIYYITILFYQLIQDFDENKVNSVMLKVVIILLIPGFLTIIKYWILLYFGCKTSKNIHIKMMLRIFHADCSFFDKMDRSFIINRFSNDLIQIDDRFFITLIFFLDFLAFCILDIYITAISVSFSTLISYFFYYFLIFYVHHKYISIRKDVYRLDFKTRTPLVEIAKNILEGRLYFDIFKKQKELLVELKQKLNENSQNTFMKESLNSWFDVRIAFFNIIFVQIVPFSILVLFLINSFETSKLVIFVAYVCVMMKRTKYLLYFMTEWETMMVSLERCESFCNLEPERNSFIFRKNEKDIIQNINRQIGSDLIKKKFETGDRKYTYDEINSENFKNYIFKRGEFEINNLWAKYEGQDNYVIKNLNLKVKSGEKLGICGKTGSGKSSFIKLILRHFSQEKGEIFIDGYDISKLDIKQLRSEFLIINQEIALFEGTLKENMNPEFIKYRNKDKNNNKSKKDLNEPLIIKSDLEHVEEDKIIIENLIKCGFEKNKLEKNGLDFKVESGGSNLSNGEKQLISLFKIFFTKKKIIILDEATSSMDVKSEKIFLEIFDGLITGKTLISIAHRVTSIVNCDNIIVLSQGEIIESGHPQTLLQNKKSLFKKYLNEMK